MTPYRVSLGLHVTATAESDDIDAFTDRLMEELVALNEDADLGGSITTGHFTVWVTVDADAPLDALQKGAVVVKTAAHAAGGETEALDVPAEWPAWIHEVSLAAEPVGDLMDA